MPKTRNVNRTQWSAAPAKHRDENRNAQDEEKENIGKQITEARTHRQRGMSSTFLGVGKTSTKRKGVSKTTTRKMPLQDITSKFLPMAELNNRGVDSRTQPEFSIYGDAETRIQTTANSNSLQPHVASPLPPSSPPSEPVSSPVKLSHSTVHRLLESVHDSQYVYDPWGSFDDIRPALPQECSTPSQSNSDPFGFSAVERKLKQDREIAAALAEPDQEAAGDVYEDLNDLPVADTSSPRPVPRIKERLPCESEENGTATGPLLLAYPNYWTPPTPHKDKQKHRRLSHQGHDVFSPCSSSVESSPSPTKVSSSKRPHVVQSEHDPLTEFNREVEKSFVSDALSDMVPLPKRQRKVTVLADQDQGHGDALAMNLRPQKPIVVPHKYDDTSAEPQKRRKTTNVKNQKNLASKSQDGRTTDEVGCYEICNVTFIL